MAKSLADRITEARGQGYKDDDIARYLVQSGVRADEITSAFNEGYSATQTLDFLTRGRPAEERAMRAPGLVARGALPVATGAAMGSPFGPVGMAAGALAVPAAEAATQLYNIAAPESMRIPTPMQAIGRVGTMMGLPQPETVPEQMMMAAGGGAAGAVGMIPGMARLAQTAVTPTGRALAGQMAAAPGQQIVAGAAAPAVGEAVADVADSQTAGLLASLVAGGAMGARRGEREIVPTAEAMKDAASAAYERANLAGVIISPERLQKASKDLFKVVDDLGYLPASQPNIKAFLDEFDVQSQQPLSLDRVERLRRIASNAAASRDPSESKMGMALKSKLDDFVTGLKDDDLVVSAPNLQSLLRQLSGEIPEPQTAVQSLKEARSLYSRGAKAQEIDELMERAANSATNYSQSGIENAIRIQFRQLANNKTRIRKFTADEQALIKDVVRGGPVENALRYFGKLAPTGVVSGGVSSGAGYAVGGPVGAVAVPAIGTAARELAGARTQAKVDELIAQILLGRPVERGPATYFSAPGAIRSLLTPQVEVE